MNAPDGKCHCSEGVSEALKREVRPYLLAAIETGWSRLWVAHEVDMRRLELRRSASRVLSVRPKETQAEYDVRLSAYIRTLLPATVVAGRPRRVNRQPPTNTVSRRKKPRRRKAKVRP